MFDINSHTSFYLFLQVRLLWHRLLLHILLALKYLHMLVRHCFLPFAQSHPNDRLMLLLSQLGEVSLYKVYIPCYHHNKSAAFVDIDQIDSLTEIVYIMCLSQSRFTPRMFRGSLLPLSTIGIGIATVSPTLPDLRSTRDLLTILSACDNWKSRAHFLCWSIVSCR